MMLHELLFVLALLIYLSIYIANGGFVRVHKLTYVNSAKSQVAMLEDATNMYVLAIGSCPTTKQGLDALLVPPADLADPKKWQGPYLDKVQLPVDPWNNAYRYESKGKGVFRVWSCGPDGISGTKDDISTQL